MMKSFLIRTLITIIFFSFSFIFSGLLLSPTEKEIQKLEHEVTVTLKLIQVSVVDKEGNAVSDLKQEDFQLFEDGELKEIAAFETHFLAKEEKKIKKAIEEKAPETKPEPSPEVTPSINRKFFLLIDYLKNDIIGIKKAKKAAAHFIETKILPTDEVSVLSYSRERGMTLHLYSSTDRQKALEAIKRIKGLPGMRWTLGRDVASSQEESQSSGQAFIQEREQIEARVDARLEKDRVYRFTSEIGELAKALWHIPGNKNIVLFSSGIQRNLIYDQSSAPVQEQAQFGLQDVDSGLVKYVEDMSKDLAASNCPVFAVNTEGARGRLFENSLGARGDHALKMISDLSGGKYFPDVEDRDDIAEEIQQFTGNYYVLGYYVDETWDGKYHEIQVKVNRKACRVYAQKGYFNPKPFSKFSGFEKKLDVLALATGGKSYFQNTLKLSSISLPFGNIEDSNFVIVSKIPTKEMKEIISSDTEVISLVLDEENNIILNERQETNFTKTHENYIYHYSILPLETGSYECRVLLRNLKTGKAAVAESSITIPEEAESGMKLYPPLLLVPEESACYSKSKKKDEAKPGKKALSLKNIYPLIPSKYFPLVGQVDRHVTKLLVVMRFHIPNIEQPALDLKAYLVEDSPARTTSLASSVIFRKKESKNIHVFLIECKLPVLKPGRYFINFVAGELKAESMSQASTEIQIK